MLPDKSIAKMKRRPCFRLKSLKRRSSEETGVSCHVPGDRTGDNFDVRGWAVELINARRVASRAVREDRFRLEARASPQSPDLLRHLRLDLPTDHHLQSNFANVVLFSHVPAPASNVFPRLLPHRSLRSLAQLRRSSPQRFSPEHARFGRCFLPLQERRGAGDDATT